MLMHPLFDYHSLIEESLDEVNHMSGLWPNLQIRAVFLWSGHEVAVCFKGDPVIPEDSLLVMHSGLLPISTMFSYAPA